MTVDEITREISQRTVSDGSINYIAFTEIMETIQKVVSLVLGIFTVAALILIPIVVLLEVSYLCFPIMRNKVDDLLNTRNFGTKALGLALSDAKRALEIANTRETGKSPLFVYLGIKLKAIIIAVIAITLAVGGGSVIVNLLDSLLGGVVEAILYYL